MLRESPLEEVRSTLPSAALWPSVTSVAQAMGYPSGVVPDFLEDAVRFVAEQRDEPLGPVRGGTTTIPDVEVDPTRGVVELFGAHLGTGRIITPGLAGATTLVAFVCTAGDGIERLVRSLTEAGEPVLAFVADTIGSLLVEAAADRLEHGLAREASALGLSVTRRFSPGYCGWPVSDQQHLFRVLPSDYCGVTLNESSLMSPIKSVSGILGVGAAVRRADYACARCDDAHCLRRRGRTGS